MIGVFLFHTAVRTHPPMGINLEMMDDLIFREVVPDGVIFWLISQNDL